MEELKSQAKKAGVPLNHLIEKALRIYLDQLTKLQYIRSYKKMGHDDDIIQVAEEGMTDYLNSLEVLNKEKFGLLT
jgi:hypothetical protein